MRRTGAFVTAARSATAREERQQRFGPPAVLGRFQCFIYFCLVYALRPRHLRELSQRLCLQPRWPSQRRQSRGGVRRGSSRAALGHSHPTAVAACSPGVCAVLTDGVYALAQPYVASVARARRRLSRLGRRSAGPGGVLRAAGLGTCQLKLPDATMYL